MVLNIAYKVCVCPQSEIPYFTYEDEQGNIIHTSECTRMCYSVRELAKFLKDLSYVFEGCGHKLTISGITYSEEWRAYFIFIYDGPRNINIGIETPGQQKLEKNGILRKRQGGFVLYGDRKKLHKDVERKCIGLL